MLKLFLLVSLTGHLPAFIGLVIWAIGDLLGQLVNLYFYFILFAALISWFAPMRQIPAVYILHKLTAPLFALCQRWIPPLGGLDFSPLILLIALQVVSTLINTSLIHWGMGLSLG